MRKYRFFCVSKQIQSVVLYEKGENMKKTLLLLVLALSFTVTACGNNSEKVVKDTYKEMGLDDDEINEIMSELDAEDLDELAEIYSEIEEMESDDESEEVENEPAEKLSFYAKEGILHFDLSAGFIQIYDMTFPIDGSATIGDAVSRLENSSLDLEYTIPKDGMVTSSEHYSVYYAGDKLFTLNASKISDADYDNTYDSMLSSITLESGLNKEFVWYSFGISEGMDLETLEDILAKNNLTDDEDSTKYHYHWNADSIVATVPASSNTLKNTRYEFNYTFAIDTNTKTIKSVSLSSKDTNMKDYAKAMGYLNNAKAITSTEEVTDAVIAKLDEFDDVYIGQNLKFVFSEIKPTTADLYAITFTTDGLVYIMSKCSTEEGGTQYVESLIAPIYVSDSGEVFVSYSSDEPLITFDASYDQKFTSGYASGDFLVVG